MSSVTDVVVSATFPSVYFLTVENWYKAPAKILASFFRGGAWPPRPHSGFATGWQLDEKAAQCKLRFRGTARSMNKKKCMFNKTFHFNKTGALMKSAQGRIQPVRFGEGGAAISVIFGRHVLLRFLYCKRDEVYFIITKQWTTNWPYIANVVFRVRTIIVKKVTLLGFKGGGRGAIVTISPPWIRPESAAQLPTILGILASRSLRCRDWWKSKVLEPGVGSEWDEMIGRSFLRPSTNVCCSCVAIRSRTARMLVTPPSYHLSSANHRQPRQHDQFRFNWTSWRQEMTFAVEQKQRSCQFFTSARHNFCFCESFFRPSSGMLFKATIFETHQYFNSFFRVSWNPTDTKCKGHWRVKWAMICGSRFNALFSCLRTKVRQKSATWSSSAVDNHQENAWQRQQRARASLWLWHHYCNCKATGSQ